MESDNDGNVVYIVDNEIDGNVVYIGKWYNI
jgi:hypothetical protein